MVDGKSDGSGSAKEESPGLTDDEDEARPERKFLGLWAAIKERRQRVTERKIEFDSMVERSISFLMYPTVTSPFPFYNKRFIYDLEMGFLASRFRHRNKRTHFPSFSGNLVIKCGPYVGQTFH